MTSPQPRVGKVASFLKTQQEYPPEETQRASIAKKSTVRDDTYSPSPTGCAVDTIDLDGEISAWQLWRSHPLRSWKAWSVCSNAVLLSLERRQRDARGCQEKKKKKWQRWQDGDKSVSELRQDFSSQLLRCKEVSYFLHSSKFFDYSYQHRVHKWFIEQNDKNRPTFGLLLTTALCLCVGQGQQSHKDDTRPELISQRVLSLLSRPTV